MSAKSSFSGLRPKPAFRLDTAPGSVTIAPGVATVLNVQLHGERPQPVAATVRLLPPKG